MIREDGFLALEKDVKEFLRLDKILSEKWYYFHLYIDLYLIRQKIRKTNY